jgi:hypothetical protein
MWISSNSDNGKYEIPALKRKEIYIWIITLQEIEWKMFQWNWN